MREAKKIADAIFALRRAYDKLNKISTQCKTAAISTIIADTASQVLELLVKLSDSYVELLKK